MSFNTPHSSQIYLGHTPRLARALTRTSSMSTSWSIASDPGPEADLATPTPQCHSPASDILPPIPLKACDWLHQAITAESSLSTLPIDKSIVGWHEVYPTASLHEAVAKYLEPTGGPFDVHAERWVAFDDADTPQNTSIAIHEVIHHIVSYFDWYPPRTVWAPLPPISKPEAEVGQSNINSPYPTPDICVTGGDDWFSDEHDKGGTPSYLNILWCVIVVDADTVSNEAQCIEKLYPFARAMFLHQPNRNFVRIMALANDCNEPIIQIYHFDRSGVQCTTPLAINGTKGASDFVRAILGLCATTYKEGGFDPTYYWTTDEKQLSSITGYIRLPFSAFPRPRSMLLKGEDSFYFYKPPPCRQPRLDELLRFEMVAKPRHDQQHHIYDSGCIWWDVDVPRASEYEHLSGRKLTIKDFWELQGKKGSDEREVLQSAIGVKGVAQIVGYTVLGSTKDGRMSKLEDHSLALYLDGEDAKAENRNRCLIAMERYGDSVSQFREPTNVVKAFRDVIEGHRKMFETLQVLHRNISPETIRFGAQERFDGGLNGVLVDWENATAITDEDGDNENRMASYHKGIPQFLSTTALKTSIDPALKDRHTHVDELECFFWAILYIVIWYDGPGHSPYTEEATSTSLPDHIRHWLFESKLEDQYSAKERLLRLHLPHDENFNPVDDLTEPGGNQEDFLEAISPFWGNPIHALLSAFRNAISRMVKRQMTHRDQEDCDLFSTSQKDYDEVLQILDSYEGMDSDEEELFPATQSASGSPGGKASAQVSFINTESRSRVRKTWSCDGETEEEQDEGRAKKRRRIHIVEDDDEDNIAPF